MIQRKAASSSVIARFPVTTKLFVLDTNVLMHDPTSLFRFEEHDLYVPMATLEELDNNKKGMSEVARNARQASRYLDEMLTRWDNSIADGIPLEIHGDKSATGHLFLQTEAIENDIPARLAGPTLVWRHGDRMLRLEADIAKSRALAIARSIP